MPAPLAALLAVAAVTSLAWATVIPPLQGNDEIAHFAYTQRIVETGDLPQDTEPGTSPYSTEVRAAAEWAGLGALVGNRAARPAWSDAEEERWELIERRLDEGARADGTGTNPARQNPPLYYAYEAVPYAAAYEADFFDRLFAMRLWSILLHVATVALAWLIAGELLGGAMWVRALAAAVVALHPQLAYIGGVVNPDTALAAFGSAFIYAAIRFVRHGPSLPRSLALGGTTAAILVTHPRGLPFVLPAVLAVGVVAWRRRAALRSVVAGSATALAAVAAGAVGYLVVVTGSGGEADGGPLGTGGGGANPFEVREFLSYLWQFYLPRLPFQDPMIGPDYGWQTAFSDTFYGVFASLEVLYPESLYDVLQWLSVAGLVALAVALVRRRREIAPHGDVLVVLAATAAAVVLGLHFAAYRNLLSNPGDPIIVGRYLFPLIALFGVAVAFVVSSLPRRAAPYAAGAVVVAGVLLQLTGLGLSIGRFYA
ncbi:MAG: DUF2142 domain-containing protein [Thermoleophilaceae bacterium]